MSKGGSSLVGKKKFVFKVLNEYAIYAEDVETANGLFSELLEHQLFSDDIVRTGEKMTRSQEVDDVMVRDNSGALKPVVVTAAYDSKECKWILGSQMI